jgi:hypothetical protein
MLLKYNWNDQIKEDEMDRVCSTHGGGEECIQGFDGKARRKVTRGRSRSRWEDNIKMGLREIGWGGMDWIRQAQDGDQWRALVNTVMNLRVP